MSSKKQSSSTANVSKQQIPAAMTAELSCSSTNTTNVTASKQKIPAAMTADSSCFPTNTTTASHSAASDILGKTSMLKLLKL